MNEPISKVRVGLSVLGVLVLAAASIWGVTLVAQRRGLGRSMVEILAAFEEVGGLRSGDPVRIRGLEAGLVDRLELPDQPGGPIIARLRIDRGMRSLLRADAGARIVPQSALGGRAVELDPGSAEAAELGLGAVLAGRVDDPLDGLVRQASQVAGRLDRLAESAGESLRELTKLSAEIREGDGTLGKLVKDPAAYERLVELEGRSLKVMQDLEDNLMALKQIWPLSNYFDERGFRDLERVLYQPGAVRESRMLSSASLFERDRAVLTPQGRNMLDGVAAWFQREKRPSTTEIVIAAFTDEHALGSNAARILTEEQAAAVKRYLMSKHNLQSAGFLQTRKIAAVGCGTWQPAEVIQEESMPRPARRVEIILFTPQT